MDITDFILERYFPRPTMITSFDHLILLDETSKIKKDIEDKFNGVEPKLNRQQRRARGKLNE